MGIKEAKKEIAKMEGSYWVDQREGDTSGRIIARVHPEELQALADSHTEMLKAVKGFHEQKDKMHPRIVAALEELITQAES